MLKKVISVIMTCIVTVGLLASCASSNADSAAAASKSTLDKILENGKVRVAILPDNPGWSVLGTDDKYKGVDADIARLLGEALGVDVEFEVTDGAGRIPMLQSGKADVVIACLTATDERAKTVAFTDPYAASGILGLCSKDKLLNSWDALEGKKISVTRGSTNDIFATEKYKNSEIVRFDAIADAFTALKAGKVDVLLEEDTTVNDLAAKNPEFAVMPVDQQKSSYICMAVARGDQEWLNYLNNFIGNALYSGEINEAYHAAFGADMPSLKNY